MNGGSRAYMARQTERPLTGRLTELRKRPERASSPIVRPDGNFALLNFPGHPSVGDGVIYLAELSYFDRRGTSLDHVSTLWDCDWEVVGRSTNGGTIYLSRGGSSVMCGHTFAGSGRPCCTASGGWRVILLPQVAHFSSQENLDGIARITGEHGSSTRLARNDQDFEDASQSCGSAFDLCTDMAFRLKLEPSSSACVDTLLPSRRGKEAAATYDIATVAERCDSVCLEAGAVSSDFCSSAKRHLA
jgi:pyruvyl transferase EpsO